MTQTHPTTQGYQCSRICENPIVNVPARAARSLKVLRLGSKEAITLAHIDESHQYAISSDNASSKYISRSLRERHTT